MSARYAEDVLTTAGRRTRSAATVITACLVLAGTFVGQDDDFPFGPFRMYATRDDPDGEVRSARVEAVDRAGRGRTVDERSTGLKRAEVEGQVQRFVSEPETLGLLAEAHARLRPDESPLVEVRVVERSYILRDSRPTGEQSERVIARWTAR